MQNITSVAELKYAIQELETERKVKEQLLREQFYLTYESLKPVNILRNTLKNLFSSENLLENISGNAIGSFGGFILKRIFVGKSATTLKKLVGAILQFGIAKVISQNSDQIKTFGQAVIQNFFTKKDKSHKKQFQQKEESLKPFPLQPQLSEHYIYLMKGLKELRYLRLPPLTIFQNKDYLKYRRF